MSIGQSSIGHRSLGEAPRQQDGGGSPVPPRRTIAARADPRVQVEPR